VIQKISTERLYDDCASLAVATQASWDCYTARTQVKTPKDALKFYVHRSLGSWRDEVETMVNLCLRDPEGLRKAGLASGTASHKQPRILNHFTQFVFCFAGNRTWSNFVYDCPPLSYAAILSADDGKAAIGMRRLKVEWSNWVKLEAVAQQLPEAIPDRVPLTPFFTRLPVSTPCSIPAPSPAHLPRFPQSLHALPATNLFPVRAVAPPFPRSSSLLPVPTHFSPP
jgi:hypothetical protein